MEINYILIKPLLTLLEGITLKFQNKIIIDKNFKKVRYLVVTYQNDNYYINTKDIFSNGKDAITTKTIAKILPEKNFNLLTNLYCINLQSEIFTYLGDYVAILKNIEIDENYFIKNLILDCKQKDFNKIISTSSKIIIVDDIDKKMKIRLKKGFPKPNNSSKNIPVNTLLPRITSNINFLQGRIVTKDIIGYSGEIIIKKNTIINNNVISIAKIHFKTQELIYNSAIFDFNKK